MDKFLQTYRVADLVFSVLYDGLEESANYAPFKVESSREPVFTLETQKCTGMPEVHGELFFQTDEGPGFPEIGIFKTEDGWCFQTRPLPGQPVAGILTTSADFTQGKLQYFGKAARFALDNALMLQFSFASAKYGALEMHSSVVMRDGKGYMFLGKSGTGKSTHSSLWLKHIPGTELLNDDNPILRLMPDGSARVFGSPWSGKTPCYKQADVPAGAIVRLKQAPENKIEKLSKLEAYASIMASASSFRPFAGLAGQWHHTLEALVAQVPCYALDCLPDAAAAELCYSTVHD